MGVSWCRDGQQESWGGGVRERGEVGGGGGGGAEGCRSGDFRWLWFPATVFLAQCFQRSVGYLCNEILMECVRVTLAYWLKLGISAVGRFV